MGWVCHTWIYDTDHYGHPGNIMVDARSSVGNPRIAFIDHAFSMGASWNPDSAPAQAPDAYYLPVGAFPKTTVSTLVKSVQNASEEAVNGLISCVPSDFLNTDRASLVRQCLVRRQGELERAFAQHLGS